MEIEKEVTKEEFKVLYFKYATPHSGWTQDYWNQFFENETGKKYFFTAPASANHVSMFITTDKDTRRIVFMTEESEESFFDYPGKE
ncbi:hypothetical protein IT413_02190 [Candidatus Peregrinibacteria bacterium]|nr:hypothetical protein [Candidatus Peregrinibacteria bacterium]